MYGRMFRKGPGWDEFDRLRREMESLLGAVSPTRGRRWESPWRETRLFPLLNVVETAESFVVTAEIPGMRIEDLEINIDGETLTLKGERRPDEIKEDASYHRRERAVGAFQRSLTLPGKVDSDNVEAIYRNGVLTVSLSKEKAAQPRRITVENA